MHFKILVAFAYWLSLEANAKHHKSKTADDEVVIAAKEVASLSYKGGEITTDSDPTAEPKPSDGQDWKKYMPADQERIVQKFGEFGGAGSSVSGESLPFATADSKSGLGSASDANSSAVTDSSTDAPSWNPGKQGEGYGEPVRSSMGGDFRYEKEKEFTPKGADSRSSSDSKYQAMNGPDYQGMSGQDYLAMSGPDYQSIYSMNGTSGGSYVTQGSVSSFNITGSDLRVLLASIPSDLSNDADDADSSSATDSPTETDSSQTGPSYFEPSLGSKGQKGFFEIDVIGKEILLSSNFGQGQGFGGGKSAKAEDSTTEPKEPKSEPSSAESENGVKEDNGGIKEDNGGIKEDNGGIGEDKSAPEEKTFSATGSESTSPTSSSSSQPSGLGFGSGGGGGDQLMAKVSGKSLSMVRMRGSWSQILPQEILLT